MCFPPSPGKIAKKSALKDVVGTLYTDLNMKWVPEGPTDFPKSHMLLWDISAADHELQRCILQRPHAIPCNAYTDICSSWHR